MERLTVELGARRYPILIGAGLLRDRELLAGLVSARDVLLVSDEVVAPLWAPHVHAALGAARVVECLLPDGEAHKGLPAFSRVNHPAGKNLIGAFHQPVAVVTDTDTLATLPARQLRAGLAEVVKCGLVRDAGLFTWLEEHVEAVVSRDPQALAFAIRRACECKAAIVAADECERGDRALLNLGHTFAHAIETATGHGAWLHGEAVAMGLDLAARLSAQLGWLDAEDARRVRALLVRAGLPVDPPALDAARVLEWMGMDKKVRDGRIRLVLLDGIGRAVCTHDYAPAALRALLDERFRGAGR